MSKQANAEQKLQSRRELIAFLKFACIGVMNTAVDWVVYFLCLYALGFGKFAAGVYPAHILGFLFGVANSYIFNRRFTFRSYQRFFGPQMLQFLLVSLAGLCMSTAVMYVLEHWCGLGAMAIAFEAEGRVWAKVAVQAVLKGAASLFGIIVNYLGNRLWTFRESFHQD